MAKQETPDNCQPFNSPDNLSGLICSCEGEENDDSGEVR